MNKKRKNLEYTTKIKRGETNQTIFTSKRCKRNLADPTEFCLATFFSSSVDGIHIFSHRKPFAQETSRARQTNKKIFLFFSEEVE